MEREVRWGRGVMDRALMGVAMLRRLDHRVALEGLHLRETLGG